MNREQFLAAVAKELGMSRLDNLDMELLVDVTLKVAAEACLQLPRLDQHKMVRPQFSDLLLALRNDAKSGGGE